MSTNWLRRQAIIVLLSALVLPAAAIADTTPMLTADADGQVLVEPDLVVVTIGVLSQAPNVQAALDANTSDMTKVMAAIQAAGVAAKDVATSNFSVQPTYTTPAQGAQAHINGFEVNNSVTVKIRDMQHSGAVLDQVLAAGANRVSNIEFTLADPVTPANQALAAAIAAARQRAQLMADAAGVKLGRILSISTSSANFAPRIAAMSFAKAAGSPVPIAAGERSVTAHATMVWEVMPQ